VGGVGCGVQGVGCRVQRVLGDALREPEADLALGGLHLHTVSGLWLSW